MSSTAINLTPCQYLFCREAKALFPTQDGAFVDQSLKTLMRIIDHLVQNHPKALFVFDPAAFNNQCHLYALMVAQAVNQAKIRRVAASVIPELDAPDHAQGELIDRRFLYHAFFLSYAFLSDPKLLTSLACKALREMEAPTPSKEFNLFLKDPGSLRMHASRSALNGLFAEHMKKVLTSGKGPLYPELAAMAHTDLQLSSMSGKGTLYTFPKFAGVVYLMEALAQENIALLFKVKVVTQEGRGSFSYSDQNVRALDPSAPVIVVELVATGDSLSYALCHDIAKRCPTYSQRNVSQKNRHDPKNPCLFCSPHQIDVAPYQKRFEPVLQKTDDLFFALGADFVRQHQQPFLGLFSDRENFPKLTALFQASIPNIERYHLSMTQPLNMSVSHVYTDCAAMASDPALVLAAAYETHLKVRGLT